MCIHNQQLQNCAQCAASAYHTNCLVYHPHSTPSRFQVNTYSNEYVESLKKENESLHKQLSDAQIKLFVKNDVEKRWQYMEEYHESILKENAELKRQLEELKPEMLSCCWCNVKPRLSEFNGAFSICCSNNLDCAVRAETKLYDTKQEAIAAWNTRSNKE